MTRVVPTGRDSIIASKPDRPVPTPVEPERRPPNTAELRRGASPASLRKTIEDAEARLLILLDNHGQLLSQGFDMSAEGVRSQIAELERQRDEARLALPHAEQREEAYRQRQQQIPVLEAELKTILAGRARRIAELKRRQGLVQEATSALRIYGRETEPRLIRISNELKDLGHAVGLTGDLERTHGVEALEALADRWLSEASVVLDAPQES